MNRKSQIFAVISGNLVNSRKITDHPRVSKKIGRAVDSLAKTFREEFYVLLVLTCGIDEISGIINHPRQVYHICRLLNDNIYPYLFLFVVVRVHLDVVLSSRNARKIDGPTFILAGGYTGLALIFTAKSIIRIDQIKKNPMYFLGGILVNLIIL